MQAGFRAGLRSNALSKLLVAFLKDLESASVILAFLFNDAAPLGDGDGGNDS